MDIILRLLFIKVEKYMIFMSEKAEQREKGETESCSLTLSVSKK